MSDKELETLYPDGSPIVIGGETFMIKPFVLRNRTKVINIFTEVFSELGRQGELSNTNNLDIVNKFIAMAGERIIPLYEIITGRERDWLEDNLTIKQEIVLIQIVMEINDFPFLVSQIQNMMNQAPKK